MFTTALPGSPASRTSRTACASPASPASRDESITSWALAARGGDPDAVEKFVRALHRDVIRYVTHLGADPQNADDLTQDTFLRALGSLHRFEGRSSARSWLLSIARRAVVDSIRYAAARPRLSDTDDWQSAAERAQPRGLPGYDDGIALAELLAALPDERREAFVLTQLLGLSYAEAALVSGCPVGTVRSRAARARSSLIESLYEAEGPRPTGTPETPGGAAPGTQRTGVPVMAEKTYTVSGMSCGHCAASVTEEVVEVPETAPSTAA